MIELIKQDYEKNRKLYYNLLAQLHKVLPTTTPIDHVGSTAIPNICGKNIIDILVGAKDEVEFDNFKEKIISLGYYASKNSKSEIYQFFASREGETGDGDSHIHLVIIGTERYREFLVLRDYLLACPNEAVDYSNHKKELVERGITDRKLYRNTKSEYVSKLIERAKNYYNK